jgi:hypothetical protein
LGPDHFAAELLKAIDVILTRAVADSGFQARKNLEDLVLLAAVEAVALFEDN